MKFFKSTILTISFLIIMLFAWGFIIEPRFMLDVQEHDVEIPNLNMDWVDKKIALLADFQVGMWWSNTGMIKKAVKKVVEAKPAMVIIAGDFVYKADSAVVDRAVSLLDPLIEAKIPVFAVLGNHDYSLAKENDAIDMEIADYLVKQLDEAGVNVLENNAHSITNATGSPFHIVGIGSNWAGKSNIKKALSTIPADEPRVIAMHNPVIFRDIPADQGAFTVAAHTHGGQISLPLLPSESWLQVAKQREVVAEGWAADSIGQGNNRLYVSRGIGFSVLPARFMCRPELTIFKLDGAAGTLPAKSPGS